MKRKTILSLFGALAFAATAAFATTTSPPTVDNGVILSKQSLVINDKPTAPRALIAKKQDDGLGVPVMRVDSVASTVDYIARETWDDITGLQKKMGDIIGDSRAGMFYTKGNNGARAAPAASMDKFGDMSVARLGGNSYFGKVIGRMAGTVKGGGGISLPS